MSIPNQTQAPLLETLPPLGRGSHASYEEGACVMEAVAYVAGEPWSDAPTCVCPVITAFMVGWNDSLPNNAERDRLLKPLILEIIGTRSTKEIEERRSYLALDWLIRVFTPAWLELVPELQGHTKVLCDHRDIMDRASAASVGIKVHAARDAARDAARAAARAAARDAAWDAAWAAAWAAAGAAAGAAAWTAAWAAAWDAAGDAAWDAARVAAGFAAWDAAGDAAWDAARAAAGAAAWAAAGAAAGDALKPTTNRLQASATALIREMILIK